MLSDNFNVKYIVESMVEALLTLQKKTSFYPYENIIWSLRQIAGLNKNTLCGYTAEEKTFCYKIDVT